MHDTHQSSPPYQPDGLRAAEYAGAYAAAYHRKMAESGGHSQPHAVPPPLFTDSTSGRVRRRIKKAHAKVAPVVIVIGYLSSAAIGLWLGWLVIRSDGWQRAMEAIWGG